jgi:hypothetical protein
MSPVDHASVWRMRVAVPEQFSYSAASVSASRLFALASSLAFLARTLMQRVAATGSAISDVRETPDEEQLCRLVVSQFPTSFLNECLARIPPISEQQQQQSQSQSQSRDEVEEAIVTRAMQTVQALLVVRDSPSVRAVVSLQMALLDADMNGLVPLML